MNDGAALLDLVAAALRESVLPALDGAPAYQARIAAALIDTIARELRQDAAVSAAEVDRQRALLGDDVPDAALAATFSARLRDGSLTLADPAVAAALRARVTARAAIDQPRYLAARDPYAQ